jgi:phenylacetate-CoA ligase
MPKLLEIYHKLPYPLRVLAASLRGYSLRWWRYGPRTEALVEEALERDTWSMQQWQSWQETRLAFVLHRAATRVPYYRDYWANQRREGNNQSWEYLENWPVLTKEPLRTNPLSFVADDCKPGEMWREHTSGTTGKPLDLWWSHDTVQQWYAIFEARARRWNGISLNDPWAILGGQLVAPFSAARPPFWVWNAGLKQLYMSSYHLSSDFAPSYFKALRDHHVCYLLGYPSSLYSLARFGAELGITPPHLQVILTNSEQLYPYQRQLLQDYFQCRVVNTYGMVEIVSAASECPHGVMHLWPDVGFTEVLGEDLREQVGAGETGRLVGTGLLNVDMPLIRYQIGDRGALKPKAETCACNRPLPALGEIEGRIDDVILTPDGRRVGRLGPVFRGPLPIFESQVIQESLDTLRVLIVPSAGFSPDTREIIFSRLRDRVGEMQMTLETVESIPRSVNGKYRLIVSRLSPLPNPRSQEAGVSETVGDRQMSSASKAEIH